MDYIGKKRKKNRPAKMQRVLFVECDVILLIILDYLLNRSMTA